MPDTDVSLVWQGADGSEWDWMHGAEGVLAGKGIGGVLFPEFDQRTSETRGGARWYGVRWKPPKMTVKLQVGDNTLSATKRVEAALAAGRAAPSDMYRRGAEWRELDRRFRSSINPLDAGTLVCRTPEGERSLKLITDSVGDKADKWPDIRGFQEYDVDFTAESALWSGLPVTITIPYAAPSDEDYYQGLGPTFVVSEGTSQSMQTVQNPGDAPAWPVWTIHGPGRFTVGVGDKSTTTMPLGADEILVIDTENRTVTDGVGNSAWDRLMWRNFAQIPRGGSSDVVVVAQDTNQLSNVEMTIVPKHLGAY